MPVISVSQVNNYIKRYIDQNRHLSDLWIKGEISNYKHHYSGHIYITLKDEASTLKAVMFKGSAARLNFEPRDGMKVIAFGKISVYEPAGVYQLYIDSMIPDGKGELYAAFEQLKDKLQQEGLFDSQYKKALPRYPQKVGVISSVSGAALRDILNVLKRRYKICDIVIYPAKVQGIGAADTICDGLRYLSQNTECDVIILARGGGSIEDLWAFNEEKTARAIFECKTPVISGVGHETDYTISDFVADLRAPTPSAAAEVAVPSSEELISHVKQCNDKLNLIIDSKINLLEMNLEKFGSEYIYSKLNSMIDNFTLCNENLISSCKSIVETAVLKAEFNLNEADTLLSTLNPFSVMKRGYSVATMPDGRVVDFFAMHPDDEFDLIFHGGSAKCAIRRIKYE
ncbi:MAG: exodeoxyribonuclease VII large subunit [Clostridia bacterium]|nr:exodeoxyribonuclease VII large subunit [Clostridia bacterium]